MFFSADAVPEDQFDVELIVQCIRSSESPQTHNQALLLLATAAKFFPVSILFFCLISYTMHCYNALLLLQQDFFNSGTKIIVDLVFMSVMNGIERVVCLSQACLYAFKGTLSRDGVAIFRPQLKSYSLDKSFSSRFTTHNWFLNETGIH